MPATRPGIVDYQRMATAVRYVSSLEKDIIKLQLVYNSCKTFEHVMITDKMGSLLWKRAQWALEIVDPDQGPRCKAQVLDCIIKAQGVAMERVCA